MGKNMNKVIKNVDLFLKKALSNISVVEKFAQKYDNKSLKEATKDLWDRIVIESAEAGETSNSDFSPGLKASLEELYRSEDPDSVRNAMVNINNELGDRYWAQKVVPQVLAVNKAVRELIYGKDKPKTSPANEQAEMYVARANKVLEQNSNLMNNMNYQGFLENERVILSNIAEILQPLYKLKDFISNKANVTAKDQEALSLINGCINNTIRQKMTLTDIGLKLGYEDSQSIYS